MRELGVVVVGGSTAQWVVVVYMLLVLVLVGARHDDGDIVRDRAGNDGKGCARADI